MQDFIKIINFKLNYIYEIVKNDVLHKHIHNNYDPINYLFINDHNIDNLATLYNEIDFISNNYQLTLPASSLNKLFANNFYNLRLLKQKYYKIEEIFIFHHNNTYLNLTKNNYDTIQNFNQIDQMITDASLINFNIDNIFKTNIDFFYNSNLVQDIIEQSQYSVITQYQDLDTLQILLNNYKIMKQNFDTILFEFNLRHENYTQVSNNAFNQALIDNSFTDIYNISNVNTFTLKLLHNFVSLDILLKTIIQNSTLSIPTQGTSNNIPDDNFSYNYEDSTQKY